MTSFEYCAGIGLTYEAGTAPLQEHMMTSLFSSSAVKKTMMSSCALDHCDQHERSSQLVCCSCILWSLSFYTISFLTYCKRSKTRGVEGLGMRLCACFMGALHNRL